ncbi:MAG: MFS transporter [Woeseiaceae bacterium]
MQRSALGNRNYLLYLAGNTISLHGLWVYRVALGWQAWQLTHSEFWVGVVAFTQFFPIVLFGPLFGVLTDRMDRRIASIAINVISALIMTVLAALEVLGLVDIYLLCMLSLVQGIAEGAHTPARLALVPNLVPRHQLQSAMATNSVVFNLSRFVGPAIAGVLIALFGAASAFAFNALSYLPVIAALIFIQVAPFRQNEAARGNLWQELRDGMRYVLANRSIRLLMALVAIASLFGRGPLELLPAFAESVFQRGSTGLATLTSAAGGGAVVAGVVISQGFIRLRILWIAIATAVIGCLIVVLGVTTQFWLGVATVALLGFMLTFCGVSAHVLLQSLIDDELRGRVSSLWGMLAFGGTAFGGLIVGACASRWGLTVTTVTVGALCMLITLRMAERRARKSLSAGFGGPRSDL